MVVHRVQTDIICQDKDRAQALYDQLVSQAPNFAAVGKEGVLFEPSSVTMTLGYEDEEHQADVVVTDAAIAQELYEFLISKHPEYADQLKRVPAASYVRIHDCYHDESPPRPCEISSEFVVTPTDAIERGIPVVGSVISVGEVKVITAEFEAQVLEAKAARLEAEALVEKEVLPIKEANEVTRG